MRWFKWFGRDSVPATSEELPLVEGEDPFDEPVVWEITDTIDLHSLAPREMEAVVTAYLEAAQARGFSSVRIIHGKGTGVQRNIVRRLLARTPFVKEFSDAPDASSWGATIARLTVTSLNENSDI